MTRKLGRTTDARMAILRNLASDLIIYERLETTEAKAKELKSVVEKMITLENAAIYMHVVKLLHFFTIKKQEKTTMSFKNFSMTLPNVTKTDKVDTPVFLN